MKQYQVVITPGIHERIERAFEYIFEQSPQNGVNWLQGIYQAIDTLETMPARCGRIREQASFEIEIRELLYHSHRIIFTIDEELMVVKVYEFRHAAQDDWITKEE